MKRSNSGRTKESSSWTWPERRRPSLETPVPRSAQGHFGNQERAGVKRVEGWESGNGTERAGDGNGEWSMESEGRVTGASVAGGRDVRGPGALVRGRDSCGEQAPFIKSSNYYD